MALGWLINNARQQVEIYRLGKQVEVLDAPNSLSGEDILSGLFSISNLFGNYMKYNFLASVPSLNRNGVKIGRGGIAH